MPGNRDLQQWNLPITVVAITIVCRIKREITTRIMIVICQPSKYFIEQTYSYSHKHLSFVHVLRQV